MYESVKLLTLPSEVCAPKEIPPQICLLKLNEGPPKLNPDSTFSPWRFIMLEFTEKDQGLFWFCALREATIKNNIRVRLKEFARAVLK